MKNIEFKLVSKSHQTYTINQTGIYGYIVHCAQHYIQNISGIYTMNSTNNYTGGISMYIRRNCMRKALKLFVFNFSMMI